MFDLSKRWWVFGHEIYEARGGLHDLKGTFDTKSDLDEFLDGTVLVAEREMTRRDYYEVQVYDSHNYIWTIGRHRRILGP